MNATRKKAAPAVADALFEIGTEELPATNLADLFESARAAGVPNMLEERLRKVLADHRLVFADCQVLATPRRLVFWVKGLSPQQAPKDQVTRVLARAEAYGPDGQPAEKLLMILRHRNADLKETVIADSGGKEYVFIRKAEPVRRAVSVLPEACEALVRSLTFPKNMKWDDSGLYFPRPIRHYLCLYGDKPVRFRIGRTPAEPRTIVFSKGLRRVLAAKSVEAYFSVLRKNGVLLDPWERRQTIQRSLEKLAESLGGRLYDDPFLLSEVTFLVENPHTLEAPFAQEFLRLPLEVLTVSMARKQRIFGLLDKQGKVMPRFLAVLDGPAKDRSRRVISTNIEKILQAKLQDSLFFFREDAKVALAKKREELKNLVFLKGAGSMLEKSDRLVDLAGRVAADLPLDELVREALERACHLAKADLLSQMVGEFPELQGVMGKYYALESGECAQTAEAIGEQYLPRTAQDRLPETQAGAILSLLDKLDLVVACFGRKLEPSSSADPYGLRRSATAVMKIILDKKLNLRLYDLLKRSEDSLAEFIEREETGKLTKKIEAFFKDRFKALLVDRGFRDDLVDAALATDFRRPYECFLRVEALAGLATEGDFLKASKVVERTVNMLKGNKEQLPENVEPSLLAEDLERAVFERYQSSNAAIREAARGRDFRRATSLYAEAFFAILEQFFEKVFVNAEDLNVRKNRMALLRNVRDLYTREIADLSKVRPAAPRAA